MANVKITTSFYLEPKHPDTTRTYTINLASADGTNDGTTSDTGFLQTDTIASIAWVIPSGITKDSDSNTTKAITFAVSGGTDATDYELQCDVTLAGGDIEAVMFVVPVREP